MGHGKDPLPQKEAEASPGFGSLRVEALFSATKNLKHKAILMITYSSGLRVSEAARLRVIDIDSKRMMVRIQNGKKGKDRYSILSQTALECLRQYWIKYRPKEWLFEAKSRVKSLLLTKLSLT
jgi:integrase/recombinase XerD